MCSTSMDVNRQNSDELQWWMDGNMIHANEWVLAYWSNMKKSSHFCFIQRCQMLKIKSSTDALKYTRNRKWLECVTKMYSIPFHSSTKICLYVMDIKWMVFYLCKVLHSQQQSTVSIILAHIWSTRDQQQFCHRHLHHYTTYQRTGEQYWIGTVQHKMCVRVWANAACR